MMDLRQFRENEPVTRAAFIAFAKMVVDDLSRFNRFVDSIDRDLQRISNRLRKIEQSISD